MFILPNNKNFDYEAIIDAMLDTNEVNIYWFDNESGACALESLFIKNIGKTKFDSEKNIRYFQVPKINNFKRLQWMASYIREMVEYEDKEFARKLEQIILKESPYDNFIKVLKGAKEGWIYGWDSWEGDNAFEEMKIWFENLPFEIREEMDHFDDCPICQTMKEGKNSPEELKDAFRKANFKNVLDDIYNK